MEKIGPPTSVRKIYNVGGHPKPNWGGKPKIFISPGNTQIWGFG